MSGPGPEWGPDEHLLAMLHGALARDDDEAYLSTLLSLSLVLPDEADDGEWPVAPTEVGTVVVAFSSVEAMRASPAGDDVPLVVRPVLDLLHAWPDPTWSLLIDGTRDTQVLLEPGAIAELTEQAARTYPLDAALRAVRGRPRAYLKALVDAEVVVPQQPDGSPTRDLSNPGFAWWYAGPEVVLLFSSPVRLQLCLGEVPWLSAPFTDVVRHWPDGCAAAIDPDQRTGMRLPADAMAVMAVAVGARSVR